MFERGSYYGIRVSTENLAYSKSEMHFYNIPWVIFTYKFIKILANYYKKLYITIDSEMKIW